MEHQRLTFPRPHLLSAQQRNKIFAPILSALWARTEVLSTADVQALLRGLKHFFPGKADQDFIDRLQQQELLLVVSGIRRKEVAEKERQSGTKRKEVKRSSFERSDAHAVEDANSSGDLNTEDLFSAMGDA